MAGTVADIVRWTGASDGLFATAGNYLAVAGGASTPPIAGEALIVDEKAVGPLVTGPGGAVALGLLDVRENCVIDFGDEGSPLTNVDATLFRYLGRSRRVNLSITAADAELYRTEARINFASGTDITRLLAKSAAQARFATGAICDTAFIQGTVVFESMSSDHLINLLLLPGANVTCRRKITGMVVVPTGATLTLLGDAAGVTDGHSTADAAQIIICGGRVNAWAKDCILNDIIGMSGVLDPTRAPNNVKYRNRTIITDSTIFKILDDAAASSLVVDSGYGGSTGSVEVGDDDPGSRSGVGV